MLNQVCLAAATGCLFVAGVCPVVDHEGAWTPCGYTLFRLQECFLAMGQSELVARHVSAVLRCGLGPFSAAAGALALACGRLRLATRCFAGALICYAWTPAVLGWWTLQADTYAAAGVATLSLLVRCAPGREHRAAMLGLLVCSYQTFGLILLALLVPVRSGWWMLMVGSLLMAVALQGHMRTPQLSDRRAGSVELRCICGYPLRGLSGNRCPECGRTLR